ncbi:MAG: DinB family protein [Anaerolineales bacterium]|nr:DinB family protein [Anaerolineales bacterium]
MANLPSSPATVLRAGIENLEPDCWVLSVFDAVGCFSSGRSEEEARAQAGNRVRQYFKWLGKKDGNPAPFEEAVEVVIAERFEAYPWPKDPAVLVHAFFEDDARPLRPWDLDIGRRLLEWGREDFIRLSGFLMPDSLNHRENAPNWSLLDRLMGHIWEFESTVLKRMGTMLDPAEMPGDAMGRLEVVRAKFLEKLPEWAEADLTTEEFGEKWSARKALRRVLWHERHHLWELESLVKGPV